MGKRIYFITGGFGFLGQYIVKAIYDNDTQADIRVLIRTRRKTLIPIQALDRVQLIEGDMTRIAEFETALEGVETIIHNAALVSFKPSDAEAIHQANTLGTRHLLQAAVAHGCRNFILISSISAIGACQPSKPSDETNLPTEEHLQRDPYGRSKYAGECDLRAHAAHLRGIILNPSVIIGPGSLRIEQLLR